MQDFAMMRRQEMDNASKLVDTEGHIGGDKIWMPLGLAGSGKTEALEVYIDDATQDARKKHEKAMKQLAEIYGY